MADALLLGGSFTSVVPELHWDIHASMSLHTEVGGYFYALVSYFAQVSAYFDPRESFAGSYNNGEAAYRITCKKTHTRRHEVVFPADFLHDGDSANHERRVSGEIIPKTLFSVRVPPLFRSKSV